MSVTDKAKNKVEEVVGTVKEKAGDVTDNPELQAEGQADQTKAQAKQTGEKVKDAAGDVTDILKGS